MADGGSNKKKPTGKHPAFQFYVRDWLSDPELRMASSTSRGVWIDLLCYMWMMPERDGQIEVTPVRLSRLCCGGDLSEALHFLNDLWDTKFGDLSYNGADLSFPITDKDSNTKITIINRRMYSDYLKRVGNKERQTRFREKGGGDPDKWTAIRIPILERDRYMCAYCGRKADTVDHIIPKSKGGDESDENLVACCKRCNMEKNNRTPEEAGMSFWSGYLIMKHQNNTEDNVNITPPSSSSSSTAKNEVSKDTSVGEVKKGPPPCPHQKIIDLYHSTLPEMTRIEIWDEQAEGWLRARWRQRVIYQDLKWWENYFKLVRESPFLMGNKTNWQADLRWLVRSSNFAKVLNGAYHKNIDKKDLEPTTIPQAQALQGDQLAKWLLRRLKNEDVDGSNDRGGGETMRQLSAPSTHTRTD